MTRHNLIQAKIVIFALSQPIQTLHLSFHFSELSVVN